MDLSIYVINGLVLSILIFLLIKDNKKTLKSLKVALGSFISLFSSFMILILAIAVLFSFLPQGFIKSYLGSGSGFIGVLSAAILGSVLFLPAIIAFPLAGSLYNGGASVGNMVTYLSVYAAIKLPQILMELRFLGWKFTALRFVITVILIYVMSLFVELIFKKTEKRERVILP